MNAWLDGFIMSLRARGLSPHTIADYGNTLKQFPCHELASRDDILQFLAAAKVSNKTRLNYHTGLSVFYKWAIAEGLRPDNPMTGIQRPKPEERVIRPIPLEHVKLMFAALDHTNPYDRPGKRTSTNSIPTAKRNRAILMLMLDTGMRVSELCNIRCKEMDMKRMTVKLLGKGNKERIVSFGPRTAQAIWRYDHETYPDRFLFLASDGMKMTRSGVLIMMDRLCKRAGVPKYSPHDLRHTFAVNYLRNYPNIYTLQQMLGHSTLDMVRHYLALSEVDVSEAHKHASPVERWGL